LLLLLLLLLLYMLVWGWWMRIYPTFLNGKKDNPTNITLYTHALVGLEQQDWIGFLCNSLGWFPPPFSTNQHQHGARQRLQQYIYILHFPSVSNDLSVWYRCLHHNVISHKKIGKSAKDRQIN
jgi:hypothetical protein